MPSPFPGMDPYLEGFGFWPTVHHRTIAAMCDALNAVLPDAYVASIEERFYEDDEERDTYPDVGVHVVSEELAVYGEMRKKLLPVGGNEPVTIAIGSEEIREPYLQILRAKDESQVIAQIELLSPTNKAKGRNGRAAYLKKQTELLQSGTHLIEIDLHRSGEHTVACPRSRLKKYSTWHYIACLHSANAGKLFSVWLNNIRQPLPTIRVPLEKKNDEVPLDIQAALNDTYQACAFAKRIKYNQPADPPLSAEDAAWASELLKQRNQ